MAVLADQVVLRDTSVPVDPIDTAYVASWSSCGLRPFGRPIFGDATIVAPLHRDGSPREGAADRDWVSFARAVQDKERTYPELTGSNPYGDLTVLAWETGGRLHDKVRGMVSRLVQTCTHARYTHCFVARRRCPTTGGGGASCRSLSSARWPSARRTTREWAVPRGRVRHLSWGTSCTWLRSIRRLVACLTAGEALGGRARAVGTNSVALLVSPSAGSAELS